MSVIRKNETRENLRMEKPILTFHDLTAYMSLPFSTTEERVDITHTHTHIETDM